MKKEYERPEAVVISLISADEITDNAELPSLGDESSEFNQAGRGGTVRGPVGSALNEQKAHLTEVRLFDIHFPDLMYFSLTSYTPLRYNFIHMEIIR